MPEIKSQIRLDLCPSCSCWSTIFLYRP